MSRSRALLSMIAAIYALCVLAPVPLLAQAQVGLEQPGVVSSTDLVENPGRYDGTRVTFLGEAVGEAMERRGHTWLHLNDDPYSSHNLKEGAELAGFNSGMPVWAPTDQARLVAVFGDHRHQGDLVEVTAVFNAACAEHGGDMDLHADRVRVETRGRVVHDQFNGERAVLAVILSSIAALVFAANRRALRLAGAGRQPWTGGSRR